MWVAVRGLAKRVWQPRRPRLRGFDRAFVNDEDLLIDRDSFVAKDLSKPFAIDGQYDLSLCLEVAEHLPASRAFGLVEQLTMALPIVLFSAAIPGQGGTRHINEQWHCYWHKHFSRCGFECYDILRPQLFANQNVAGWFRQNIFLYAR